MTFSLEGRVALVTGNSTGLGKQIGLRLGRAGAKVPVNYFNNERRAEAALKEYEAAGVAVHLDSDLFKNISYLPLNSAEAYGRLRLMDSDGRPTSRDVVIYTTLPNQMPRVAGVITEVR